MKRCAQIPAAGVVFLSSGIAFLTLALIAGQHAFLGSGLAILTLGIVFLAKSRSPR